MVAAPPRVPQTPATWGWMLQLYALRSARSWGIGDLGDLREFIDWTAAEHGAGRGAAQPAERARPHASGAALALHPVQPAVRQPARAAHRGSRRLPSAPTRTLAPRWMRCASRRTPSGSTTISCGRPSARRWNCCGASRGDPARWTSPARPTGLRDWATYCALAERHGGRWTAMARDAARCQRGGGDARHAGSWRRASPSTPGSSNGVPSSWAPCGGGAQRRHDPRRRARPAGGGRRRRRRRVGTGRRACSRGQRRSAAGQFHPAGSGLGTAAVAPGPPRATGYAALRDMLRAMLGSRRRLADRPCRGPVAAVVDSARGHPGPGHLRALRRRRHARGPGIGGTPGRGHRRRRGLGHRRTGGHRGIGRQRHAGLRGFLVHPRRVRTR